MQIIIGRTSHCAQRSPSAAWGYATIARQTSNPAVPPEKGFDKHVERMRAEKAETDKRKAAEEASRAKAWSAEIMPEQRSNLTCRRTYAVSNEPMIVASSAALCRYCAASRCCMATSNSRFLYRRAWTPHFDSHGF